MRRERMPGLISAAQISRRASFNRQSPRSANTAVPDVQAVEPAGRRPVRGQPRWSSKPCTSSGCGSQLLAVVLFHLALNRSTPQSLIQILQACDLAIARLPKSRCTLMISVATSTTCSGVTKAIRRATAGKVFLALGVTPTAPPRARCSR